MRLTSLGFMLPVLAALTTSGCSLELKVCADGKCTFIENAGAVPTFNVR